MQTAATTHHAGRGWRSPLPAALDCPQTLALALASGLGDGMAISGRLACDGSAFRHTWVLAGGTAHPGSVAAVGLYGDRLQVGSGCAGGWMDFGPERRVTRSEGNVQSELDGKPALDLYKAYGGEMAQGPPGSALRFPLSIRQPDSARARLLRTTHDNLIDSAARGSADALRNVSGQGDALVVSVSCVARRLVLGGRTEDEVASVLEAAPAGAGDVGFYAHGEIAPGAAGGTSHLHNQTMTVTVFSER